MVTDSRLAVLNRKDEYLSNAKERDGLIMFVGCRAGVEAARFAFKPATTEFVPYTKLEPWLAAIHCRAEHGGCRNSEHLCKDFEGCTSEGDR